MIKIANAPCSWGALEFGLEGKVATYAQVLDEIRQTGYEGTELGDFGFLPTDPAVLKKELTARHLELVGAFTPAALADPAAHAPATEKSGQVAALMFEAGFKQAFLILADDNGKNGLRTRNAGRIKPGMGLSEKEWDTFAQGAERIAKAVRERCGLKTVFHHHCAGFVETPAEIDTLMQKTDPRLLGLCLDFGHLCFGGGDSQEMLKKYPDRIWHVHFKDCDPAIALKARTKEWDYFQSVSSGVFCELGKGEVDFSSVVSELKKTGYQGWITVEQDVLPGMGNPKACAKQNRDFIRRLGL